LEHACAIDNEFTVADEGKVVIAEKKRTFAI